MKGLLIDDLGLQGWKDVLDKAVINKTLDLDIASDYDSALTKIENKFKIIFLDIRLNELDHTQTDISQISGFKLLTAIKGDFLNPNFCTPIILFTASNKIWYIDLLKKYGADSYYIKEHPDFIYSNSYSKENLVNLQNDYKELLQISEKRTQIWNKCRVIIEVLSSHKYFCDTRNSIDQNIKQRVIDKIKLGYGYLFSGSNKIEQDILFRNNESISFIVFWSVLEEISKGFTETSVTWNKTHVFTGNWKFKNSNYFIETVDSDNIKVLSNSQFDTFHNLKSESSDFKKYNSGFINLSEQIYVLLNSYSENEQTFKLLSNHFKSINEYRNKTDYIHSSVYSILKSKLINQVELDDAFNMNLQVLKFIEKILKLPT